MAETTWRDRAPRSITDTGLDPNGEPCNTPTDRRWLWHLEGELSMSTHTRAGGVLHNAWHSLREYLHETCEHHWQDRADDMFPTRVQCLWCNRVEDTDEETTR